MASRASNEPTGAAAGASFGLTAVDDWLRCDEPEGADEAAGATGAGGAGGTAEAGAPSGWLLARGGRPLGATVAKAAAVRPAGAARFEAARLALTSNALKL